MPGMKTHHIFGDQLIRHDRLDWDEAYINQFPNSFYMGLQGPDIFFYALSPYVRYRKNIGNIMHNENTMAMFQALMDARNQLNDETHKDIADAYICGFMGHYTLDCLCHPYVYYRTKHLSHEGEETYDFGMHVFLETDMDNAVQWKLLHKKDTEFKIEEQMFLSPTELEVISKLLYASIAQAYPKSKIARRHITRSLVLTRVCGKLLRDPVGNKKKLARLFEERVFGHSVISGMITNEKVKKYPDPCNEKHHVWYNPWDYSQEAHTESIFDFFKEGEDILLRRIRAYTDAVNVDLTSPLGTRDHLQMELLMDLGDCSYCTGFPLED